MTPANARFLTRILPQDWPGQRKVLAGVAQGVAPYRSPQRLRPLNSGGGTFFSRASVGL